MNSKEKRAFETLIVSELRKADELTVDLSKDVELTKIEADALASLGDEFLDLVIAGKINDEEDKTSVADVGEVDETRLVLNRADDVSEDDNDELNENERALIERKLRERENGRPNEEQPSEGS